MHAFEDERVIAGQGTIGLELAEQAPDGRDRARPRRRRRARRRNRARAEGAPARACARSASSASRATRSPTGSPSSIRASCRRRSSSASLDDTVAGRRRGDHRGARPLRRADEAARRGRGRGRPRRAPRRPCPGRGLRRGRALGREHRRDDAHLGAAPRPDRGGPLPRDPAAHPGSAGRAAQRARPDRARAAATSSRVDHHREGRTTTALQTELEIVVATRDEEHCQELLASLRERGLRRRARRAAGVAQLAAAPELDRRLAGRQPTSRCRRRRPGARRTRAPRGCSPRSPRAGRSRRS